MDRVLILDCPFNKTLYAEIVVMLYWHVLRYHEIHFRIQWGLNLFMTYEKHSINFSVHDERKSLTALSRTAVD